MRYSISVKCISKVRRGFRTVGGFPERSGDNLPFLKGTLTPKTALESAKVVSMYALVLT